MKAEFTAIIEPAPEGGYWAICPEIPGANGQGETIEETKNSLRQAIELILEDRRADVQFSLRSMLDKITVRIKRLDGNNDLPPMNQEFLPAWISY